MARRVAFVAIALAASVAGCTGPLFAAHVPDTYLGSNGWERDPAHSEAQPRSDGLGGRQTLAYADDGEGANGGYPASLALTTLKIVPAPGEAQLRTLLEQQVRQNSEAQGIRLGPQQVEGGRTLADGHATLYFVFTGNVTGQGTLFTTSDAEAKILGEVWNCPASGTSVAAVGLAQVSNVRRIGSVALPAQRDEANWRELAGDPSGTVDGQEADAGLLYRTRCRA